MKHYIIFTSIIAFSTILPAQNQHDVEAFKWPGGAKAAVSLSYDNTLDSQLDNAIPSLNKHGFKASFYLTLSSPILMKRFSEWKKIAEGGHELGNHTIFHSCRRSLPDREWVAQSNDLDNRIASQIVLEIKTANTFLHAIDGKFERTYTAPCWDWEAGNENFYNTVKPLFVGIKYDGGNVPEDMEKLDILKTTVWGPNGNSGAELIAYVEKAAKLGSIAGFTFHDIDGDVNNVTKEAHEELLTYLADHRDEYWVDTFLNISRYVRDYSK